MSQPTTEAGKRLASDLDDYEGLDPAMLNDIAAIEAEARAAVLREVRLLHVESPGSPPDREKVCLECWGSPWPCRTEQLARRLEADDAD